ncbi:hypothetical protein V8F33_003116 [Rhypophila sp. PSN 637]
MLCCFVRLLIIHLGATSLTLLDLQVVISAKIMNCLHDTLLIKTSISAHSALCFSLTVYSLDHSCMQAPQHRFISSFMNTLHHYLYHA